MKGPISVKVTEISARHTPVYWNAGKELKVKVPIKRITDLLLFIF